MKLKILGATCQSNTATWRQDQGSTYHPRFQISIFCLNTFFFFFFFTKPYTVLKMTCRQNNTDLWKANHKLCSNTHFSASETHFTWSRNSDFLLKITSGTKDYKAYFPKANVPPTLYRTLEKMLRMKQRGKPWMLKCRGEERRPFVPRVLTILQKLSPFGKWEEWIWGLDKDILSDTKILWVGNLNHHDSQQKDPLSKWSHSWEKGDGWIWEVAQQTL